VERSAFFLAVMQVSLKSAIKNEHDSDATSLVSHDLQNWEHEQGLFPWFFPYNLLSCEETKKFGN
jgi:hypothetical protein